MNEEIVLSAAEMVREKLENEGSGHDWFHIERVWKNAIKIGRTEKVDMFVVQLAALLHDLADDKIVTSEEESISEINYWLEGEGVPAGVIEKVLMIIQTMSYKGGNGRSLGSLEAKVVQDADRLDAIGAIGIARAFTYGGSKGQPIFDPQYEVREEMTKEEYRNGKTSTVHHFYEKLLKLKDLMNTESAIQMAQERHQFMEQYLEEFFKEYMLEADE
ncbi:metal-dependent phosphohydrolase [Marinilactibacillus psychrotolerans]|uniref:HD domain-containing protein n=2 Tax=Marinilactibacillus psychrotolerans TaxID=191770 RepID=A0A5R9BZD2_9LACT|nr:HD domain-containing protein [Marinilactibacillus psychrotolerans]TLQ05935.1 HD domain-containing protein [Marinilactibacillus psychrotolerans]GEQ33991.1 metal-dependent phosphohydrolase [Marinilactibacillus psychrotolerans]SJN27955.1 HD domain protein [Marinilactibacillus psychrotolerans 42ea]